MVVLRKVNNSISSNRASVCATLSICCVGGEMQDDTDEETRKLEHVTVKLSLLHTFDRWKTLSISNILLGRNQ